MLKIIIGIVIIAVVFFVIQRTQSNKKVSSENLVIGGDYLAKNMTEEGVITTENAHAVRAKTIIEVANGPILSDAETILEQNGIAILPDVLVNAGGVTVSYFEWVQNRSGYPWDLDEVRNKLELQMTRAFHQVWQLAEEENRSFRSAAYAVAMRRIGEAVMSHGSRQYFGEELS